MVDILGGMSNSNSESQQVYLAFKTSHQQFFANGETPVEFQYLQLDPSTFKSGWGRYTKAEGFEYHWDEKFGVVAPKPADDYKRAFSAWVFPQGAQHAYLWQRFTYAESSAFNSILGSFWNQMDSSSANLPVVKYEGSKPIQVGMGNSSELSFSFAKFAPRTAEFVIPSWYLEQEAPVEDTFKSPNDGLSDKVAEMVNQNELSDDDIPF